MREQVGTLQGLGCEAEDVVDGYKSTGGVGWSRCVWGIKKASVFGKEGGKTWLIYKHRGQRALCRCLWPCSHVLSLLGWSSMLCRLPPLCIFNLSVGVLKVEMYLLSIKVGHCLIYVGKRTWLHVGSEIWLHTSEWQLWISMMEISAIKKPDKVHTLVPERYLGLVLGQRKVAVERVTIQILKPSIKIPSTRKLLASF